MHLVQRFWPRVKKTETCWLWIGTCNMRRYGVLQLHGRMKREMERCEIKAHRLSWELHHGPIPSNMQVLHKCDVRNCVNPDHLFLGTQRENIHDMDTKGRRGVAFGTDLPQAKLTNAIVLEMRRLHREEGIGASALARQFSVAQGTAWKAITPGWGWTHVE